MAKSRRQGHHLSLEGGGVPRARVGDGLRDQVLVILRVVAVVAHAGVPAVVPCASTGMFETSGVLVNYMVQCSQQPGMCTHRHGSSTTGTCC